MPWLECKNLTLQFGTVRALDDVTLNAEQGSWTWLMGPSGSGKTTLLRAIAGLADPAAGTIRIDGEQVGAPGHWRPPHLRGCAFLPQAPSLWPHLSARANVELVLSGKRAATRQAAMAALEQVGVADLAGRFPAELSGGQARLVEIARALAARARLVLLDEPAAHLDLHLREELMIRLQELHQKTRLTTLCVAHQPETPLDGSARVALCEAGKIVYDGAFSGLAEAPQTAYIHALTRAVERILKS